MTIGISVSTAASSPKAKVSKVRRSYQPPVSSIRIMA